MRWAPAAAALALAAWGCGEGGGLEARDAWLRATPIPQASAYLVLENRGPGTVRVVGARSEAAGAASIHRTEIGEGGLLRMRAVDTLELAAGESVRFGPGAYHVMLDRIARPLVPGDTVPVTLLLAGGDSVRVAVEVRAP